MIIVCFDICSLKLLDFVATMEKLVNNQENSEFINAKIYSNEETKKFTMEGRKNQMENSIVTNAFIKKGSCGL